MSIVHLDERLACIFNLCEPCISAIDVGCDHGYLAINLILNHKAKKVIASDIAQGPLEMAKQNIEKYKVTSQITLKQCDGIDNETFADLIIIAGMGGLLICNIIQNTKNPCKNMILQANNNIPALRKFLSENHFMIVNEEVCKVNHKYYEILKVKDGYQSLNQLQIEYGPINLIKKTPLFIEKYTEIYSQYLKIISSFNGSKTELEKINLKIEQIKKVINI